jgi:hypothetical protein
MIDHFVDYDTAFALKELGYDEPCFGSYRTHYENKWHLDCGPQSCQFQKSASACIAPFKSQVFKWFREKYHLDAWVVPYHRLNRERHYCYLIETVIDDELDYLNDNSDEYPSHEEAENKCIENLISFVKTKNNETKNN